MKKILLVDDSATVLASMSQVLERGKYEVEACVSPELALTKLGAGFRPDLVITDLNMPGMDGVAFITAARKQPSCRFIPILVLTTESGQAQRDRAKAAGATGWLVKPVAPDKLFDVLKQVLA
jgi:two-component system chemotaxis response regulator CheY